MVQEYCYYSFPTLLAKINTYFYCKQITQILITTYLIFIVKVIIDKIIWQFIKIK